MKIPKQADTQISINSLIASRWSGRAYDSELIVSNEQIMAMLEAAHWAPSCFGDEPWRYIVCNRHTNEKSWQNALNCLVEGNQQWAKHAPVLIVALANTIFSGQDKENRWGEYDTGAASISMCLQATELGLMTHQMGGILSEKIIDFFSVPAEFTPMTIMSVGYQLSKERVPSEMLEREMAVRKRKPFDELFFAGHWGEIFSRDI